MTYTYTIISQKDGKYVFGEVLGEDEGPIRGSFLIETFHGPESYGQALDRFAQLRVEPIGENLEFLLSGLPYGNTDQFDEIEADLKPRILHYEAVKKQKEDARKEAAAEAARKEAARLQDLQRVRDTLEFERLRVLLGKK